MNKILPVPHATILLFALLFFLSGCKKDGVTTPEEPKETNCTYLPGNSNFTWRADTVAWWPSTMGGIWAFSDSDAYAMGYMAKPKKNGRNEIYLGFHWNGTKWDTCIYGQPMEIKHYTKDLTGDDRFMVSVGSYDIGNEKAGLAEFDNKTKKWKGYQYTNPGELYSVWTDGKGFFIAGGTKGMIYTKESYSSQWVYSKAPTDFTIKKITGISKNELYIGCSKTTIEGIAYGQLWEYSNDSWTKLFDGEDTANTIIKLPDRGRPFLNKDLTGIAAFRCPVSDSLYFYLSSSETFELKSKGNLRKFTMTNLADKGLPDRTSTGLYVPYHITLFSPKDYWLSSTRYRFYHYNGTDFKKIEPMSYFPYGSTPGVSWQLKKTSSGKMWILLQESSQIYSVLQGTL